MTIKSSIGRLNAALDDPVKWAIRLSLFAAAIAIWVKSGGPITGYETVLFALAIGFAALMFEYQAAKKMTHGWFDRAPAAVLVVGDHLLAARPDDADARAPRGPIRRGNHWRVRRRRGQDRSDHRGLRGSRCIARPDPDRAQN